MPKGVYKHKANQGFQKGHKLLNGGNSGNKHTEETRKNISISNTGKTAWNKGLKGFMSGDKNGNWKGGLPNCVDCGKQVSSVDYIRCHSCNCKFYSKDKVYNWKGGYENKLMHNKKEE